MTPAKAAVVWDGNETNLKKLRVKQGLSQTDLARLTGIPKRRILTYEHGEICIDRARLETICKLAAALGCNVSDLLEGKELKTIYKQVR